MAGLLGDSYLSSYTPTARERITDFLARNWFGDNREGTRKAERLMDVASLTPLGIAPSMYDAGRDAGQGNYGSAALNLGMAMAPGPKPKGIRAFHGSPHDFNAFDMSKIGTGEGAQAYGHGLYFAEKEGVAKNYRDQITFSATNKGEAARFLDKYGSRDAALKGFNDEVVQSKAWYAANNLDYTHDQDNEIIRSILTSNEDLPKGRMYEVSINAHPDQFLDWDKPLSEQSPQVRETLHKEWLAHQDDHAKQTGEQIYRNNTPGFVSSGPYREPEHANASQALKAAGIPGIKYLDQGSRAAGDGSRNYVVFDDKLVSILKKYGLIGLLGGGGATGGVFASQQQNGLLGGGA